MGRVNGAHQFARSLSITYGVGIAGAVILATVDRRTGDVEAVRDLLGGDVDVGRADPSPTPSGAGFLFALLGVAAIAAALAVPAATAPRAQPTRSGNLRGVKALRFSRNEGRYAAAMLASRLPSPEPVPRSDPLSLVDDDGTRPPHRNEWIRVHPRLAGICGSGSRPPIDGRASRYFEDFVSFPFVPGHEVVADTADGRRVVLEPVLGHECPWLRAALRRRPTSRRRRLPPSPPAGISNPGIQTGFCESTGGGLVDGVRGAPEPAPTRCPTG